MPKCYICKNNVEETFLYGIWVLFEGSIYWLMFFCTAAAVLLPVNFEKKIRYFFYSIFFIFVFLLIGLRDNIGGDWNNYLEIFQNSEFTFFN